MDRPPPAPGTPGTGGENPPTRPGPYAGDPDRTRPPEHAFPDYGDQRPEPSTAFGPVPPASPGPAPRDTPIDQADPMPTVPIPRLPDAGSGHPASPVEPPGGVADPELLPPAATEPQYLPPAPAGHSTPPPDSGAPGHFSSRAAEQSAYAGYEGSWADWMTSSDGYPPRPGGENTPSYAPDTGSASWDNEPPVDDVPAKPLGVSVEGTPDSDAGTTPTTARERLRARLAPREVPAPVPVSTRTAGIPGRKRLLPVLLGVAGVAALGAAAYVQFAVVGAGEQTTAPTAANPPAAPAQDIPPAADPNCPAERIGNTVQGNGPGGTGSGTDAIFGFQHAYYVTRSGEQARTVVAPDAAVPPAADIQHGIDTIPAGTTHCLQITPGAFVGQYTVVVTEHRPGAAPLGYNPQLVTTMRIGDRTLITGIGPMP